MTSAMSTFTGRHGLGKVRTIAEFRQFVDSQPSLTIPQRKLLVEQATVLLRDLYVHLPLKRAMHAVDPVQRLRLLGDRLEGLDEREFHAELIDIFMDLRDLHTNYMLPAPYGGRIAFLGILIEQFFEDGKPRWMISKVAEHLITDDTLKEGALISHWNGMPMELAVWRNADKEAGSNPAARFARGLESMTLRFLGGSLPPDEDWVDLVYTTEGQEHESRLAWHVFDSGQELISGTANPQGLLKDLITPLRYQVGLDQRTEIIRQTKKLLFSAAAVREESRVAKYAGAVPPSTAALKEAGAIPTSRPDDLTAKLVDTPSGTFGYLRIWTFHMKDGEVEAFVDEVMRLLTKEFPPEGLIIDVRGNGGGYIIAAEFLLQMLTPRRIEPEPAQFINTPVTLDLTGKVTSMKDWHDSLLQGVRTGAQYSRGIPLSPPDVVNLVGQVYHGPVVLITDAFCYSACDMFAAGFQDHKIGMILGVDNATGAGGANVLDHEDLRMDWTEGPLSKLPAGAGMRVSLRRTLRVGDRVGQPVEDLGVEPDVLVQMTKDDLLASNRDLQNKAGAILAKGKPRKLGVEVESIAGSTATLKLTTLQIPEVDIYVNDRPQGSAATPDGTTTLTVQIPAGGTTVRLQGFENGILVGARLCKLN
jgi:C-terminal processing protease CtpA/Prc